jgi:hypothetical protein
LDPGRPPLAPPLDRRRCTSDDPRFLDPPRPPLLLDLLRTPSLFSTLVFVRPRIIAVTPSSPLTTTTLFVALVLLTLLLVLLSLVPVLGSSYKFAVARVVDGLDSGVAESSRTGFVGKVERALDAAGFLLGLLEGGGEFGRTLRL